LTSFSYLHFVQYLFLLALAHTDAFTRKRSCTYMCTDARVCVCSHDEKLRSMILCRHFAVLLFRCCCQQSTIDNRDRWRLWEQSLCCVHIALALLLGKGYLIVDNLYLLFIFYCRNIHCSLRNDLQGYINFGLPKLAPFLVLLCCCLELDSPKFSKWVKTELQLKLGQT